MISLGNTHFLSVSNAINLLNVLVNWVLYCSLMAHFDSRSSRKMTVQSRTVPDNLISYDSYFKGVSCPTVE